MARSGTFKCASVTDVKVPSLSAGRLLNEPHVRLARILASQLPTHLHRLTYSEGRNARADGFALSRQTDATTVAVVAVWRSSRENLAGLIRSGAEGLRHLWLPRD